MGPDKRRQGTGGEGPGNGVRGRVYQYLVDPDPILTGALSRFHPMLGGL
jgi:hypothetical protein